MKPINYKQLVIATLAGTVFASLCIGVIAKFYLVEMAVDDISKKQSKQISKLAFELLYAGMEQGWKKEDFEKLAGKISIAEPDLDLKIKIYKNEKLSEMFGESALQKELKSNDLNIIKAMSGEEVLINKADDSKIRYLYPVIATKACIKCHTNVKEGYINGVIDIAVHDNCREILF